MRGNAGKRRRVGVWTAKQGRLIAQRPDQVCALDSLFNATSDGRLLNIVDEHARKALAIAVSRAIDADVTIAALEAVVADRGTTPAFVHMDNGPERTSAALREWCRLTGAATAFIEPGAPGQNGYAESFNARLRDELLSCQVLDTLTEAKVHIEDWHIDYNSEPATLSTGEHCPGSLRGRLEIQPGPYIEPGTATRGTSIRTARRTEALQ